MGLTPNHPSHYTMLILKAMGLGIPHDLRTPISTVDQHQVVEPTGVFLSTDGFLMVQAKGQRKTKGAKGGLGRPGKPP